MKSSDELSIDNLSWGARCFANSKWLSGITSEYNYCRAAPSQIFKRRSLQGASGKKPLSNVTFPHKQLCCAPMSKKCIDACNKTYSWMRLRTYPIAYGRLANAIPWGTGKRAVHKNVAFELCPSACKAGKDVICCAASLFQFSQEKTTASCFFQSLPVQMKNKDGVGMGCRC